MKTIPALMIAAATLLAAPAADAAVVYAFQAPGGLSTYLSPGFVGADTGPHPFAGCVNSDGLVCQSVAFDVASPGGGGFDTATLRAFDSSLGVVREFNLKFAAGDFGREGIHVINAATAMAVIEVGDFSPGSVLYLLSTRIGGGGLIADGLLPLDSFGLSPQYCVAAANFECSSIDVFAGEFEGDPGEFVLETFFQDGFPVGVGDFFRPGAVATPGIHQGRFGGALAVVPLPDSGAVPEPATWAVLLTGFGLLGAELRRRGRAPRLA